MLTGKYHKQETVRFTFLTYKLRDEKYVTALWYVKRNSAGNGEITE